MSDKMENRITKDSIALIYHLLQSNSTGHTSITNITAHNITTLLKQKVNSKAKYDGWLQDKFPPQNQHMFHTASSGGSVLTNVNPVGMTQNAGEHGLQHVQKI
jgi:hypothetical protein